MPVPSGSELLRVCRRLSGLGYSHALSIHGLSRARLFTGRVRQGFPIVSVKRESFLALCCAQGSEILSAVTSMVPHLCVRVVASASVV